MSYLKQKCLQLPIGATIADYLIALNEVIDYGEFHGKLNNETKTKLEEYFCANNVKEIISQENFNNIFKKESNELWRKFINKFIIVYNETINDLSNYDFFTTKEGQKFAIQSPENLKKDNQILKKLKPKLESFLLQCAKTLVSQNPQSISDLYNLNLTKFAINDKSEELLADMEQVFRKCEKLNPQSILKNNENIPLLNWKPLNSNKKEGAEYLKSFIDSMKDAGLINIIDISFYQYKEASDKNNLTKRKEFEEKIFSYVKIFYENNTNMRPIEFSIRSKKIINYLQDLYIFQKKTAEDFSKDILNGIAKKDTQNRKHFTFSYQKLINSKIPRN